MNWLIISLLAIIVLTMSFVVITDGRYFGKRLTYWLYNRFGAALFGSRSEAARWRQLAGALAWRGDETMLDLGTAVGDLPLTLAVITCLGLLETLPHPDQILHEMVRVLQPGGKLALSLYRGWSALSASLSLNWYQKQLQSLGFELHVIELRRNHDIVVGQKIDN